MNNKNFKIIGMVFIFAILVLAVAAAGCTTTQTSTATATPVPSPTTRTVTDVAGRNVVLPYNVTKVIVFGSPPLDNSVIMAMGKGDTIINALPSSMQIPKYKFETVFVPQLANQTVMTSGAGGVPNIEQVLSMDPDVVISDSLSTAQLMDNNSIPAIYIGSCFNINETKAAINVLGQVYNDPARAKAYSDYCDAMLAKVTSRVSSVPVSDRPRVLYLYASMMYTYNGSGWIVPAGGIAALDTSGMPDQFGGMAGRYSISMEQLLKWNPDVIIIHDADSDFKYIQNKTEFNNINAVKNNKVYAAPIGACWWYRGPENPLLVEWTASKLYPDKFPKSELISDMKAFYKEFYGYQLTDKEADEMLSGMANATVTP